MDTEWSLAMANSQGAASDTARVLVYEGSNYTNAIIMDVYTQMEDDANARTMSTSWGIEENIQYSSNPEMDTYNATMQAVDNVFSAMVGEGWTLVAASGDQGATAGCSNIDAVQFPASDPNVVGAGGTELNMGAGDLWEVAWTGGNTASACGDNDGGGTGGFSEYFTAPSYQSGLKKT
jgi:kumamolisin